MDSNHFEVVSPVDDSVYTDRSYSSSSTIETVLNQSRKAFLAWKNTSIEERQLICSKVVEYFISHAEKIGEELTWQMGRPIRYTPSEINKGFQERAHYMIEQAPEALKRINVTSAGDITKFMVREPLGTVLVLAPWNYPYLTSVNAIIPAIMAGNSVILKHSDQTPLCAERYAQAFAYANAPEGLFQFLHINHDQVAQVIQDSRICHVAFTGSVSGGLAIQKAASERFINIGLELGGKDPAYVRNDANLEFSIENLVDGTYFNSGQSCCGIERIYVHEQVYDTFLEGFVELTKKYRLGNPNEMASTLGPLIRKESVEFIQYQIDEAIQQGAKPLIDSHHFDTSLGSCYMAPQVLTEVNHNMRIMRDETFGPVVGIMPVKDDEEAIELINDTVYGLTASIWTEDQPRATSIGSALNSGTVFMNRCDYLDPALAWTGVKHSGRGVTLSHLGYDHLTRLKSFHLRK